jgi:hypothetical protein
MHDAEQRLIDVFLRPDSAALSGRQARQLPSWRPGLPGQCRSGRTLALGGVRALDEAKDVTILGNATPN